MQNVKFKCSSCIHAPVCIYIEQMRTMVTNINTDIDSGNYPSNIELDIDCIHYKINENIKVRQPDSYM